MHITIFTSLLLPGILSITYIILPFIWEFFVLKKILFQGLKITLRLPIGYSTDI